MDEDSDDDHHHIKKQEKKKEEKSADYKKPESSKEIKKYTVDSNFTVQIEHNEEHASLLEQTANETKRITDYSSNTAGDYIAMTARSREQERKKHMALKKMKKMKRHQKKAL